MIDKPLSSPLGHEHLIEEPGIITFLLMYSGALSWGCRGDRHYLLCNLAKGMTYTFYVCIRSSAAADVGLQVSRTILLLSQRL